jgi:hypothetical protein
MITNIHSLVQAKKNAEDIYDPLHLNYPDINVIKGCA